MFPHGSVVLLEGSWPPETPGCLRRSLDDSIDGRCEWIDVLAVELAEELREIDAWDERATGGSALYSSAELNALSLRYYLVKLARIVAYFTDISPLQYGDELEVVLAAGKDEYLADLFQELAAAMEIECCITWCENGEDRSNSQGRDAKNFPKNGRWRRLGGRLARLLEPDKNIASPQRRVVLCGNPRILDPLAEELLRQGCRLWWLYDRFAVTSWLRWRPRGVGQLFCDSSMGGKNRLMANLPEKLDCLGVNLAPAVGRWMAARIEQQGRRQTRAVREINSHFRRIRPHRLVLSEDATPFARAAVGVASLRGVRSFVLQHGVPGCRFGFAPLAADHFLAWGNSSKQQLVDWGIFAQQITVTGSPQHDGSFRRTQSAGQQSTQILWGKAARATGLLKSLAAAEPSGKTAIAAARQLITADVGGRPMASPDNPLGTPVLRSARSAKILLLATTPPRDSRPDAVALHFNPTTHAQMLRISLAAVAKIENASLEIKLHPRAADDPILRRLLTEYKSLRVKLTRRTPLQKCVARADCVLSCMSSAGVEAAAAGVPVIQILPQGSADVMPHDHWGLLGSARTQEELDRLLAKILMEGWKSPGTVDEDVFAMPEPGATAAAARAILAETPRTPKMVFQGWKRDGEYSRQKDQFTMSNDH